MKIDYKRFRDRRTSESLRKTLRETRLSSGDFILPLFCLEGRGKVQKVESMPDVFRMTPDRITGVLEPLISKGLSSVILFGVPQSKGIEQTWAEDGTVQQVVKAVKKQFPFLEVITDVCFCSYSSDGHCQVKDNDSTCALLARAALSHAGAGADVVAPSAMMDGQVYHIRRALDNNGYQNVKIMSYSAKFASNYYGPFRDAADCAPSSGDRKTYQMDPANKDEAMEEIAADIEEGAHSIIVKPALSYLDIISRARSRFECPVVGYNVSGEYRMLLDAVKLGYASEDIICETLLSIKRAGADRIISYFTPRILFHSEFTDKEHNAEELSKEAAF